MEESDGKPKILVVPTTQIPEDNMANESRVFHLNSWVKKLSLAQVFFGVHLLILETVFAVIASEPVRVSGYMTYHTVYTPCWMPYSGFWAGLFITVVGVVGVICQRRDISLRLLNIHMILNIVTVLLAFAMVIMDIVIIGEYCGSSSMSAGKMTILWFKVAIGAIVCIISIVVSTAGCRSACCGPYGCCGVGTYRYYMDKGDGVVEVQVVPKFDKKIAHGINNRCGNEMNKSPGVQGNFKIEKNVLNASNNSLNYKLANFRSKLSA